MLTMSTLFAAALCATHARKKMVDIMTHIEHYTSSAM
jgi:hypothetical protein